MRDGIYKNPSLSKPCQALLKSCTQDAERGEIARQKCDLMIGQYMQDEIAPHFITAIRGLAEDARSLLPGFRAITDQVTSRDLGGNNSPLENEILARARRCEREGLKGADLLREACVAAAREYLSRQGRVISQTIFIREGDPRANATIDAVWDAINSARIEPLVEAILSGRPLELAPARRPIDPDEDISRVAR
jgi:hypothetical protein